MNKRKHNFNPGPAALPLAVLEQAQQEFVEFEDGGMSLMEISHRSTRYEQINDETQQLILELLGIKSGYQVLFLGGGASLQFAMVPLNFLHSGKIGSYLITGNFAEKAHKEAQFVGQTEIAASTKTDRFSCIPNPNHVQLAANAAYLHITMNNTIEGTQFRDEDIPACGDVPLIADMTSHLMSRPIDTAKHALIFAGAQKNLGPAGVTVVLVRDEQLNEASTQIPMILRYQTFAKNHSLYNTPPVHSIYVMNLVLKWLKNQGGLAAMEQLNLTKANLIYNVIDQSGGYFEGLALPAYRSMMNITWRMASESLEQQFVQESKSEGFIGLSGHRSVGGLRASAYNAVPYESCKALAEFMTEFMRKNG